MKSVKLFGVAAITAAALNAGCSTIQPEPMEYQAIVDSSQLDKALIFSSQEPMDDPLTLSEAMARALKYNLENRLQLMQEALSDASYELVKLDMLPVLAATAGYFDRDEVDANRSFNIITQSDNFSFSTSQDQEYSSADIRFAWNILDFGISYFQARQEGDRYLLSSLARQRVMLRLLEQTRAAYWRAVAMESVADDLTALLDETRQSLAQLEQVRQDQLRPPLTTLQDTRALVELVQQLEEMEQSVNMAAIELATLINEPPGTDIEVQIPTSLPSLPPMPQEIDRLEVLALVNSTEYVGELYNLRIDQLESRKSMLRLWPGLEFSYGENYHSNSYRFHNDWGLAGLRLTGNIMRLLARDEIKTQNAAREQFAIARRMTMNMATIAQLHLAWMQYGNTLQRLERAEQLDSVDQDISMLSEQSRASNATSGIQQIQTEARALRSRMSSLMAYAEAHASYGSVLSSMSLNPVPAEYQTFELDELAAELTAAYGDWETAILN